MTVFVHSGKGIRLSAAIAEHFPRMTYGAMQKLFRKGEIRVNGKKVFADLFVEQGDEVQVFYAENEPDITTVYENENVAVFLKPIKIPSVGEKSFEMEVKKAYPNYLICHRLDTNTDGLIIFAKNEDAFTAVKEALKKRLIKKHYLAAVTGMPKKSATLSGFLIKDAETGTVKVYDQKQNNGHKIITKYDLLFAGDGYSFLDVELVTGRTHQIRAHLAHVGLPIIGDPKYGSVKINRAFGKKYQVLHAYKLIFRTNEGLLRDMDGVTVALDADKFLSGFRR